MDGTCPGDSIMMCKPTCLFVTSLLYVVYHVFYCHLLVSLSLYFLSLRVLWLYGPRYLNQISDYDDETKRFTEDKIIHTCQCYYLLIC